MGHRGRPRRANARHRQTTRAGRAPPPDLGTTEARRIRRLLNGREDLPADPLSSLYARDYINREAYDVARHYQALTRIARLGWGLRGEASVDFLWAAIASGTWGGAVGVRPVTAAANGHDRSAADAARRKLTEMHTALDGDSASRIVVDKVVIEGEWTVWIRQLIGLTTPGAAGAHYRYLGLFRAGLRRLTDTQDIRNRSRRQVAAE